MASDSPEFWMRRAVALSRLGYPAPNPRVGCVLVKAGKIVGEGWHRFAGGLHAEAEALLAAGNEARGAEAYVTLEPCNHQGRQPPCTEALIAGGVRRVVYAVPDPNPNVAGKGAERLRAAGLGVESGLLRAEAAQVNLAWLFSMKHRRPFVSLKAAIGLDGRLALPNGESKWITGERARREARKVRAAMGAVLIGSGTALQDDPQLTARTRGARNEPMRIVLDPERDLPDNLRVFQGPGQCLRVVARGRARAGDLALEPPFDLKELMEFLWERGTTGLLVEGGAETLSSFLQAGLADRLDLFMGNVVLGRGLSWVTAELSPSMQEAQRWRLEHVKRLGDDVWVRFSPPSLEIDSVLA